jgi:hypothetical protein
VLHPFERSFLDPAFRRIAFVVGGVDGENRSFDALKTWPRVIVGGRVPGPDEVIGVA